MYRAQPWSLPRITEWTGAEEASRNIHTHAPVLARAVQALVHVFLASGPRPTWNFQR